MEYHGIDISHWQGKVDFNKVAKTKKYCIMKVSQKTFKDTKFEEYYEAAKDKLLLGAYIYVAATSIQEAAEEAIFSSMRLRGKNLPLGVWLDIEDPKTLGKMTVLDLKKIIYKEADILKDAGFNVGIYCSRSWYNTMFDNATKNDFKFWIASYGTNTGKYDPNSRFKPAAGVMWQHTSKGTVAGISGAVDLDVCYQDPLTLFDEKLSSKNIARPTLYKGNEKQTKTEVKYLQENLNELGFLGKDKKVLAVDGSFGTNTDFALRTFQDKYKVPPKVDGIYGNNSYKKMKELL